MRRSNIEWSSDNPKTDHIASPTVALIVHVTCPNDNIATEVAEAILNEELS
jgi:hypothetical protein